MSNYVPLLDKQLIITYLQEESHYKAYWAEVNQPEINKPTISFLKLDHNNPKHNELSLNGAHDGVYKFLFILDQLDSGDTKVIIAMKETPPSQGMVVGIYYEMAYDKIKDFEIRHNPSDLARLNSIREHYFTGGSNKKKRKTKRKRNKGKNTNKVNKSRKRKTVGYSDVNPIYLQDKASSSNKYIFKRDKWYSKRLFLSTLKQLVKENPKYSIHIMDNKKLNKYEKSLNWADRYYLYLSIIYLHKKPAYLKLTISQVETIFKDMADEMRTDPDKLLSSLSDLASMSGGYNNTNSTHKGLDVYEGPLFLGYLVKQDGKPYKKKLKESKVYLYENGWYSAKIENSSESVLCNPKKYTKELLRGEKVRYISQCYLIEKTKDDEYLFLDLVDAASNDFNIYTHCDTSLRWHDPHETPAQDIFF